MNAYEYSLKQHRDNQNVLNYAKEDNRFEYIILSLDNIQGTGQTVLFDLGQVLQEVKNSGKKIIATGDYYDQSSLKLFYKVCDKKKKRS